MTKSLAYRFFPAKAARAAAALLALAAMAACGKNVVLPDNPAHGTEPEWEQLQGQTPIRFNTAVEQTKSTPLHDLGRTEFHLFGFYQEGETDPANPKTGTWEDLLKEGWTPNFMYDEVVEWDNGNWSYDPLRYWPSNPENTITFWAYSSPTYDPGVISLRKAHSQDPYSTASAGLPGIKFTTDGSLDLLVSDIAEDQSDSNENLDPNNGIVTLMFRHAMCWVDFSVKKEDAANDYDITLKSLVINNIRSSGVYEQENGWGNQVDPTQLVFFSGSRLLDGSSPCTFPTEGSILPLPQRLNWASNSPTLQIVYTFKLRAVVGDPVEYSANVDLGQITPLWERGKHYSYSISITPGNPIFFTANVQPWDTWQEAYYNVG